MAACSPWQRAPLATAATTAIAIAVVGAVLGSVATAHSASGYADVRVAARLVEDGRFEFAVQQRLDDGSWGDRVLPQRRFFPAQPGHDRWLFATPVTVSASAFEVEVRVAARRLADGRTEFGLRQLLADGTWSEPGLPRGRFVPPTVEVDRWLGSSPLRLEAGSIPSNAPDAAEDPRLFTSVSAGERHILRDTPRCHDPVLGR